MGHLTKAEIEQVRHALAERGLTYAQLQDELLDHLICDIEKNMEQGLAFQSAWEKVMEAIPENQFKKLQTETMELLNKKFNTTKIMILLSFFLLVISTVFKLLHLQGTNMLLLSAFGTGALTILVASFKGFYIHQNKKGRYLILVIGLLMVTFITSILFQVLLWKGRIPLRFISVIGLTLLLPAVSIYFFQSKQTIQVHPLILLTEENRKVIDRVVLALVGLGVIFRLPVILKTSPYNFAPILFLTLAIFAAGLYMFSLTWKAYAVPLADRNDTSLSFLLIFSIIAFVLFMLPAMPWLFPKSAIPIMALSFYILVAAMVAVYYGFYSPDHQKNFLALFSFLILLIPLLRLCQETGMVSASATEIISNSIYNIGVFLGLILLLIIFYKKPIFRAFLFLILAHYVLTYSVV